MKLLAPFGFIIAALAVVIALDDMPADGDLVFVNRGDVFTLDPQRMSYITDFRLAYALYEGLVRWDIDDFSILPAAAESWQVTSDRLTYTFRLRPEARWSNGAPLSAHDFVYAWKRPLLPDTAADYSNMFFVIGGAEDFFRWRAQRLADFAAATADLDAASRAARALDLWDETERRFARTVGLQALDHLTLQVTLARPTAYFLDLVAFGVFCPVYRPAVEGWQVDRATDDAIRQTGWAAVKPPDFERRRYVNLDLRTGRLEQKHGWTQPGNMVSNGPYVLRQWRYKRGMRLERNLRYHDAARVRSDSIVALTIEDTNTAVLAFESGRLDWLSDVNAEYQADMLAERSAYEKRHAARIDRMLAGGKTLDEALAALPPPEAGERRNIHVFPTFGTDFYSFNCRAALSDGRPNPFADARVRRAFVLSVDKQTIVDRVTRLGEPIMTTLVPPGSIPGYRSPPGLPHDPVRARAELRSAGWEDRDGDGLVENEAGEPFPVVDLLWTTNTPRYKWISLELKSQWERGLGVRIELRGEDTKFYKDALKQGHFMIARGRWYGDYGDPTTFLDLCKSTDGNNDRRFADPYVDGLLEEAAREGDPEKRLRILEECERYLFQEAVPMLVLCQLVQVYMYEPGELTGLSQHPRLTQYLWRMQVHEP